MTRARLAISPVSSSKFADAAEAVEAVPHGVVVAEQVAAQEEDATEQTAHEAAEPRAHPQARVGGLNSLHHHKRCDTTPPMSGAQHRGEVRLRLPPSPCGG